MKAGFEGGRLQGVQAIRERAERYRDGFVQAHDLGEVLGVSEIELLAIEVSDGGMSLHDDARLGAVDPRHKGARHGRDQTRLELVGALTEVPDVAIAILREP